MVQFKVSVELQLTVGETLNLTLYGLNNQSSLHLHPLGEEDEKEERNQTDGEEESETFYCCLPAPPTSESANRSQCLLWLANQTVLTATAKEKLLWKRPQKGWCQDEGAELLYSLRDQCGFTLKIGEERRQ